MFLTLFKTGRGGDNFFTLHNLQKDLFSKYSITIYSGIVGKTFKEKQYTFDSQEEKEAVIQALCGQKIKSEYKIIYKYPQFLKDKLEQKKLNNFKY